MNFHFRHVAGARPMECKGSGWASKQSIFRQTNKPQYTHTTQKQLVNTHNYFDRHSAPQLSRSWPASKARSHKQQQNKQHNIESNKHITIKTKLGRTLRSRVRIRISRSDCRRPVARGTCYMLRVYGIREARTHVGTGTVSSSLHCISNVILYLCSSIIVYRIIL